MALYKSLLPAAPSKYTFEPDHARALERANESLRRANRELEEFAYVASHDLREPLRMVNIYTQLLIQECSEGANDQARQFANHIRSSVARMEQLIDDLLNYSQIVHADASNWKPICLRESLDQALAVFEDRLKAAGAVIEIGNLPTVRAEEIQMSIVFQNLFSNALKYAHPNRQLRISAFAEPAGDLWITHFSDNGIGFEPEFAERIFGLFKRLHGRDVPGTGLGLAISRRIVERFGGSMWAEAESGVGATFSFSLKGSTPYGSDFADTTGRGQSR